ncbi:MAG: transposase [Armatimonadetes bacterium]|nr:transposase [Armatimonadota bacterium]
MVAGWQFSALVVLPKVPSSWTYTLDNQRIESEKTQSEVATRQLEAVVPLLPELSCFSPTEAIVTPPYEAKGKPNVTRVSWLVFLVKHLPPLETIPAVYGRRYSIEHGFRVDKQDVLWEEARLRTPEAFQLWTDLVACVRN